MNNLIRCLVLAGLLLPATVLGGVDFPKNPKTQAECDGPAEQLRAMSNAEHNKAEALMKERDKLRLTRECSSDDRCRNAYYAQAHEYYLQIDAHFRERDRLTQLRRKLETECRRIARANEKVTEETRKAEYERERSALQQARAAYERMKQDFERVRQLGQAITEPDKALLDADMRMAKSEMDEMLSSMRDQAYVKRNYTYSPGLNDAMDSAKQGIVDPVSGSPVVSAVQDESFNHLKSQMQQLNGEMNQLTQRINTFKNASADDEPPLLSRDGSSGADLMAGKQPEADEAAKQAAADSARQWQDALNIARPAIEANGSSDTRALLGAVERYKGTGQRGDSGGGSYSAGGGGPADLIPAPGPGGKDRKVCEAQLNASPYPAKLNAIPRGETVLLMRGTIATLRDSIRIANQCLPDPDVQQAINEWSATLRQTYTTCQQVSSTDNCLVSPF